MDTNVIVALLGVVGTFFGSLLGIVSGQKLNEFRLKRIEEKQTEQDNHIGDTDKKVIDLQITVNAVEQKVEAHDTAIDDLKCQQQVLAQYHMKKKE